MSPGGPDFHLSILVALKRKFLRFIYRYFYPYLTRRLHADDVLFLNYGYEEDPPMGVPLSPADEHDRYFIQLYHRTATQVDLEGKRVLEVGCGHGGGASYLTRTVHPASYVGLDVNPAGVAFCQGRHHVAGLEFVEGDAENLPFPDETFDAVINVESSHLYQQVPRFLDEVVRVLRPGGYFLYADLRLSGAVADWEAQLANASMSTLSQSTINEQVMRGMEKNAQWWVRLVDRLIPTFLHRWLSVRCYVLVWRVFQDMQSGGNTEYRMYCLAKA